MFTESTFAGIFKPKTSEVRIPIILLAILAFSLLFVRGAEATDSQETLKILTATENDRVKTGDTQTVYIVVLGADRRPLSNTTVSAFVFFHKNLEETFTGTTDSDGIYSFSWKIENHSRTGLEGIDIMAESPGYDIGYASLVFPVFRS